MNRVLRCLGFFVLAPFREVLNCRGMVKSCHRSVVQSLGRNPPDSCLGFRTVFMTFRQTALSVDGGRFRMRFCRVEVNFRPLYRRQHTAGL